MAKKRFNFALRKRWRKNPSEAEPLGKASANYTTDCYNSDTASCSTDTTHHSHGSYDPAEIHSCPSGTSELPKITEEYKDDGPGTDSDSDYFEIIEDSDSEDDEDDELQSVVEASCSSHSSLRCKKTSSTPLPSPRELSKELCNVVFFSKDNPYSQSRRSALHSLATLAEWVDTRDPFFLKNFLTYGGVAKVLDFLQEVVREAEESGLMTTEEEIGEFRFRITIECIRAAAKVISGVCSRTEAPNKCHRRRNSLQKDEAVAAVQHLAGVTATVVVNHDGIETLLLASELCCRYQDTQTAFDSEASLKAAEEVWNAIANTCGSANDETATMIIDDLSVSVWDTGLEAMEAFGFDSGMAGPTTLEKAVWLRARVFSAFVIVLIRRRGDFLATRNVFAEKGILWRALALVSGANWKDENSHSEDDEPTSSTIEASLRSSCTSLSSLSMSFGSTGGLHRREEEALLEGSLVFFCECQMQELLFGTTDATTIKQRSKTNLTKLINTLEMESTATTANAVALETARWRKLCEGLVPLCVTGLQKFARTNPIVRIAAVRLLTACLSNRGTTETTREEQILLAKLTDGTVEALAPCLKLECIDDKAERASITLECDVNGGEREEIRELLHTIVDIWDELEWDGEGELV